METRHGVPLAYFITFRTHGTWLPGDPRGFVDAHHRAPGTPYAAPSEGLHASSLRRLKHPPVWLTPQERTVVLKTIQEVCRHRGWVIRAVHVRVNHVHVVVRADHTPERVMNDLKAWCTRRVTEAGLRPQGTRLWVRHGSTRYLWSPAAVEASCVYVVHRQGVGQQWAAW